MAPQSCTARIQHRQYGSRRRQLTDRRSDQSGLGRHSICVGHSEVYTHANLANSEASRGATRFLIFKLGMNSPRGRTLRPLRHGDAFSLATTLPSPSQGAGYDHFDEL